MNTVIILIDKKYRDGADDDGLRETAVKDVRTTAGKKAKHFKAGERVILPANKAEGWPEERGTVC